MNGLRKKLGEISPLFLINTVHKIKALKLIKFFYFKEKKLIKDSVKNHQIAIEKLKEKTKIKVAFFTIHSSIWKYDELYKLMENDERFEPVIIVCPYLAYGKETMLREMSETYNLFIQKNYKVLKSYDIEIDQWLDVKKEIKPDIIFFSSPYSYSKDEYLITNFLDCLTCYVQYSFHIIHLNNIQYDQLFHNLLWKAFYETKMHYKLAKKHSRNKAENVVITGYPGTDIFLNNSYKPKDVWKIKDRKIKRIIWAPHHTIDENKSFLSFSCFLIFNQVFIDIACKYKQNIQIAFKPHPLLKNKLYNHIEWGKIKTDKYYEKWDKMHNGQLEENEYIDLFISSDAMILNSCSFMTEYLFLDKPSLFLIRDNNICDRFNPFGKMIFQQLYHARNFVEITEFIEKVVLEGNDYMKDNRNNVVRNHLTPPNNKSASQNIFDDLVSALFSDS